MVVNLLCNADTKSYLASAACSVSDKSVSPQDGCLADNRMTYFSFLLSESLKIIDRKNVQSN